MLNFRQFRENSEYRGSHSAPDRDFSAPLHDVTHNGMYPKDVYSHNGMRYYGDGSEHDSTSYSVISACRNKPNARVKIYRAVPKILGKDDKIADIESQKRYIQKHGKVPGHINTSLNTSEYYDQIHKQLQDLHNSPDEAPPKKPTINPNDWVTLARGYARDHGEAVHGKGNYKILSKTVPAKHLVTDANSFHEWGYAPTENA